MTHAVSARLAVDLVVSGCATDVERRARGAAGPLSDPSLKAGSFGCVTRCLGVSHQLSTKAHPVGVHVMLDMSVGDVLEGAWPNKVLFGSAVARTVNENRQAPPCTASCHRPLLR
jgi:hypothetical protein